MVGKMVVVCGYGDVGKGLVVLFCGVGVCVQVIEVDLICVLQVVMDGFEVVLFEDVVVKVDIFIIIIGNKDVICIEYMCEMKDMVIVGNIGYFDNEIQVVSLWNYKWMNIKDQVDMIEMLFGSCIILLFEGCLLNFGNVMGYLLFVMFVLFMNQVLVQIELWIKGDEYELGVYILFKYFDEKVVCLYFECIGVKLIIFFQDQVEYIGVMLEGLFKLEYYCY